MEILSCSFCVVPTVLSYVDRWVAHLIPRVVSPLFFVYRGSQGTKIYYGEISTRDGQNLTSWRWSVCWRWRFDWSFTRLIAPVVITTSITVSSNKIQNGDILVPANSGPRGKWPLNGDTERDAFLTPVSRCQLSDLNRSSSIMTYEWKGHCCLLRWASNTDAHWKHDRKCRWSHWNFIWM